MTTPTADGRPSSPRRARCALLPAVLLLLAALNGHAHPTDFREIVSRAGPAVVNIRAITETEAMALPEDETHRNLPDFLDRFFGDGDDAPTMPALSTGSGFVIDPGGLIVTNRHVVDNAHEIRIRLSDRREFSARIVGTDRATDIALLEIEAQNLPAVEIGDSSGVAVGDWVVAIGSPFNFENTVTAGIVSAKGRSFPAQQYVPFLQTDVPINRGNSGGPLLDMGGRVIGVNSQIFSENGTYMGLSFSIPIEIAMSVVDQLRDGGSVERGLLGVSIEDVSRELSRVLGMSEPRGAVVTSVTAGSAADRAGLQPWDVIVAFDGQEIRRFSDLPPLVGMIRPGSNARLTVHRAGEETEIDAVIGRFDTEGEEPAQPLMPDVLKDPPERLGLELAPTADGLEVVAIELPELWRAGLFRGDIIESVNQARVRSIDDFDRQLEAAANGPVAMLVRRGRGRTFVVMPGTGS
ncbi:MAG: Do family serine endopeptidase [Xanthomonadales bacterium]|nr:Do family serine endopeptidase [Xanthomonadales bacterium]